MAQKITEEMVEKLLKQPIDESKYFIPKDYEQQEKDTKSKK